ncbi:MAG: HesA/MoeB/ThiF family protein [Nitrospirae bacterium]|nr:HesA/MoeB/ThiF family protein [Nitrospirota bacterium]
MNLPGALADRQMTLPGWTPEHQERLGKSRVFLAGVGGVGGVVAQYLAMAGVGELVLVHEGALEFPDLNRQTLMEMSGLGKSRAGLASERLSRQVPGCRITAIDARISPWMEPLAGSADLLVDARTNFEERFLLGSLARKLEKPLVFAAMNGMEGMVVPLRPGSGPCLECLFPEGDPAWDPLGFPVLGAISGAVGAMAAVLSIRILSGYGGSPDSRMTLFEGMDLSTRSYRIAKNGRCAACREGAEEQGSDHEKIWRRE